MNDIAPQYHPLSTSKNMYFVKNILPDLLLSKQLISLNCRSIHEDFTIDVSNLNNLTSLDCSWCHCISGIENLINLRSLDCSGSNISDKTLEPLTNLTSLNCAQCNYIKNIDTLTNLTDLNCAYCYWIGYIGNLTNLKYLHCEFEAEPSSENECIKGIENLTNLTWLNCSGCCEINNVSSLSNLTFLNCSYCYNIENIERLTKLKYLVCFESEPFTLDGQYFSQLEIIETYHFVNILNVVNMNNLHIIKYYYVEPQFEDELKRNILLCGHFVQFKYIKQKMEILC